MMELKDKDVILKYARRSANNLAHSLASYSYSLTTCKWESFVAYPDLLLVLEHDLRSNEVSL